MALPPASALNGEYIVNAAFKIYNTRVVVAGVDSPLAEFFQGEDVTIKDDRYDPARGGLYAIRNARNGNFIGTLELNRLIGIGVLKRK